MYILVIIIYAECSRSCKGILDTLNTAFPARKPGFKVEIFVRNIDENSDTYQMVAYAPENGLSPESYLKVFDLTDFRTKCEKATTDINYSDGSFYKVAKKPEFRAMLTHFFQPDMTQYVYTDVR